MKCKGHALPAETLIEGEQGTVHARLDQVARIVLITLIMASTSTLELIMIILRSDLQSDADNPAHHPVVAPDQNIFQVALRAPALSCISKASPGYK